MPFIPANLKQQSPQQSGFIATPIKRTNVPAQQPEQDGFFNSVAKSIVKPFAREAVNVANVGRSLGNIGRLTAGAVKGTPIEQVNIKPQVTSANLPWLGETKAVGVEGTFGQRVRDSIGTGAEIASTVIPAGKVGTIAKATLGGKILQGATTGFKAGVVGGGLYGFGNELQNPDATVGSVVKSTGVNTVVGGLGGGVLGGLLPVPIAGVKGLQKVVTKTGREKTASNIMNRVARTNPSDIRKFEKMAGESVGEYLTKRGIYGDENEIMTKLYDLHTRSRNLADSEIAKLGGNWKAAPIKTALDDLVARESRISTVGAPSKDFIRVKQLAAKHQGAGLTMPEINEAKRLFERNVRLDYLKQNLPTDVARANTIDDAIRSWQFTKAKQLGLNNLPEINKETQLTKQLGDALWKKYAGQQGNNAMSLTDAVLLSGGDPSAIGMLATRKIFGSKKIQSKIAQKLAPTPSVLPISAKNRAPIKEAARLLPSGENVSLLNQGRPIPIFPQTTTATDYVGGQTVVKPTGGYSTTNTRQYQTGSMEPVKTYSPTIPQAKQKTSGFKGLSYPPVGSVERMAEETAGFPTGLKEVFDEALARKDAQTVNDVLHMVPKSYQERFSKEISNVLKTQVKGQGGAVGKSVLPKAKNISQSGKVPLGPLTGAGIGSTAGFERDENGKVRYNVKKGLAGAAAGAAIGYGGGKAGLSMKDVSKNIHPEDLATMKDFTDLVAGDYRPSEKIANALRKEAQTIADRYGFTGTASDKALSNQFGRVIEAQQNTLDKWSKSADSSVSKKTALPKPKGESNLIQEAKKHNSAEEFVKNLDDKLLYHGSPNKFDNFKVGESPVTKGKIYFTEHRQIAQKFTNRKKGGNIIEAYVDYKNPLEVGGGRPHPGGPVLRDPQKYDYDAIVEYDDGGARAEVVVFDPSIIKTKSQLIDIYNRAHGK